MWWLGVLGLATAQDQAPPPDVGGRYVMTLHVVSRAKVPVVGWVPSRTVTTVLVDLTRLGEQRYQQRHEVCDIRILSDARQVHVTIPRSFVDAMPDKTYPVTLERDDDTWLYVADLEKDHIGFDPALTGSVPERSQDPGVTDPDSDGHPGMTVVLKVPVFGRTELYVAQFGWLQVRAPVVNPARIEGRLEVAALQQRTLKASNPLFSLSPRIEPVPGASWFVLQRSPGASCSNLPPG